MVSAPSDRREDLLKELEQFAFRGIPNVASPRNINDIMENEEEEEEEEEVSTP